MKYFYLLTLIFFSFCLNAQGSKNVEEGQFKLNALVPGASYELGLGINTTLNFDLLLTFGARGGSEVDTRFGLLPGAQVDFRYFTNMKRRIAKGKNISGNSGNYLGVSNQFYLGDALIGDYVHDSDRNHIAAITYGLQRTRPKGFYWGFSVGPGIYTDDYSSEFTFFIDLRLGWVLSKRK